jgi:hypothetical protein
VVGIATAYGPEGLELESRQGRGEFSFLQNAQTDSGAHPASHSVGTVPTPLPGVKRPLLPLYALMTLAGTTLLFITHKTMPSRNYLSFIVRNILGASMPDVSLYVLQYI